MHATLGRLWRIVKSPSDTGARGPSGVVALATWRVSGGEMTLTPAKYSAGSFILDRSQSPRSCQSLRCCHRDYSYFGTERCFLMHAFRGAKRFDPRYRFALPVAPPRHRVPPACGGRRSRPPSSSAPTRSAPRRPAASTANALSRRLSAPCGRTWATSPWISARSDGPIQRRRPPRHVRGASRRPRELLGLARGARPEPFRFVLGRAVRVKSGD